MTDDLARLRPDHVFDGGDLDCGSGLVLLIREHMQRVPPGGVLELQSREPTVASDLPPWCRLAGHAFLGSLARHEGARYFVRRGIGADADADARALDADKQRARDYEWRLRVRRTGPLQATVYCRNFQFAVGQPASFEAHDQHPSAVEYALGALAADLGACFAQQCSQRGLELDDLELTAKGRLHDVLAHLGLHAGDPAFASIAIKCFASTTADAAAVQQAFAEALQRSPLLATLRKAAEVDCKLSLQ